MDSGKIVKNGESETTVGGKFCHIPVNVFTKEDILMFAHSAMGDAFSDWIGTEPKTAREDLWYLWGVFDLADRMLMELEKRDDSTE